MTREVTNTDGGYDRLYGFPWGYVTGNIGCTGCYQYYLLPFIGNLAVDLGVVLLMFRLVSLLEIKLKGNVLTTMLSIAIICFSIFWFSIPFMIEWQDIKLWNTVPYQTVKSEITFMGK